MARVKVSTFGTLYKGYIARLKSLGCVLCPGCYCYMPSDHACARTAVEPLGKAA